jgi:hypothetical protein
MRGVAHVGALKAIQEVQGSLEFPDGIYGSSVGAIIASFVAFNVPMDTMMTAMNKYFKLATWLPYPSVSHVWSISKRKGVFSMDMLRKSIVDCFSDCGIKDVETKRIRDALQPLFVVASNMSTRRPAILTGDVLLIDAILCSCCIPGLFEPQVLYGDVYLDAGVYVRAIEQVAPPNSLAIKLHDHGIKITPQSSMYDIFYACYVGIPKPQPGVHVCSFKDIAVGIMNDLTDKEREDLMQQGYSQTRTFLTKMAAKEGK